MRPAMASAGSLIPPGALPPAPETTPIGHKILGFLDDAHAQGLRTKGTAISAAPAVTKARPTMVMPQSSV